MKDYDGHEIRCGDVVVEALSDPDMAPWRWHVCVIAHNGKDLELRDLNANNIGMAYGKLLNRGPYWKHLDKLSDADLDYHFGANRELCERLLKMEAASVLQAIRQGNFK